MLPSTSLAHEPDFVLADANVSGRRDRQTITAHAPQLVAEYASLERIVRASGQLNRDHERASSSDSEIHGDRISGRDPDGRRHDELEIRIRVEVGEVKTGSPVLLMVFGKRPIGGVSGSAGQSQIRNSQRSIDTALGDLRTPEVDRDGTLPRGHLLASLAIFPIDQRG